MKTPPTLPPLNGPFADFEYWGRGPLTHRSSKMTDDIAYWFDDHPDNGGWVENFNGSSDEPVAIRRGTELHRLNFPAPAPGGEVATEPLYRVRGPDGPKLINQGECDALLDAVFAPLPDQPAPPPGATPVDERDEVGKRIFKLRRQLGLADDMPDESVLCLAYDKIAASAAVAKTAQTTMKQFDAWLSFRPEFSEVLTAFRQAFGTDTSAAALATGQQPSTTTSDE